MFNKYVYQICLITTFNKNKNTEPETNFTGSYTKRVHFTSADPFL